MSVEVQAALVGIPQDWRIVRLKHVGRRFYSGGTPTSSDASLYSESGTPWLMISDLTRAPIVTHTRKGLSPKGVASKGLRTLPAGTIVYSMYASVGAVATLAIPATVNQAIIGIEPGSDINGRFLHLYLESIRSLVAASASTSTQANLNAQKVKHLPVPVPDRQTQDHIVRYLDNAELRIARAIQAKLQLAKLLRESRQSTILHQLLTDGGSRPVFPGGNYLAPAEWRNVPFWAVARETKRTNRPNLDLLSVFLDRGVIRYGEGGGQVHKPSLDLSAYQEVRPGDLVLNNQQAWRGSVGVSKHGGIVSPAYVVCSLGPGIDAEWANSYFRSPIMVDQFALASRGVGSIQRQLHGQSLMRVRVFLPSLEEQRATALRIRAAVSGIDAALASLEREIVLLREYRMCLISDVVTGKKDVHAEAARMKHVDAAVLASVLAGSSTVNDDELGEDDDAE